MNILACSERELAKVKLQYESAGKKEHQLRRTRSTNIISEFDYLNDDTYNRIDNYYVMYMFG